MNAVISGQSGVAVLVDGFQLASMHAGSDAAPVERSRGEVRFLLDDARDLEFLEDIAPEEVRNRLELATTKYDALHLALILLDPELVPDTRRTAAEELDDLLADDAISIWVESVLYARPLPRSGDLMGARSACTRRTRRTRAFLVKLESLQPVIAEIHEAWESIPTHRFGTDEDRQRVLAIAVKKGMFRDLVAIRAKGTATADARQVLQLWVERLRGSEESWAAPAPRVSYVAEDTVSYQWDTDDDEEL